MALSKERMGEIALLALKDRMNSEGMRISSKGIKREITNEAKRLGVPVGEFAEFVKEIMTDCFGKATKELNEIK